MTGNEEQIKQVEEELSRSYEAHWSRAAVFGIMAVLIMAVVSNDPLGQRLVQLVMAFLVGGAAFLWGGAVASGYFSELAKLKSGDLKSSAPLSKEDANKSITTIVTYIVFGVIVSVVCQLFFGFLLGGWAFGWAIFGQFIGAWVFVVNFLEKVEVQKPKRR